MKSDADDRNNEMVGLFLKYFVLSPLKNTAYGAASRKALLAYAEAIDKENPKLAFELQSWASHAKTKAGMFGKREIDYIKESQMKSHPYEIGKNYFIRTITHYYTGQLAAVYDREIVLTECAWIADTGRFADAIKEGTLSEVEPIIGSTIIGREAIVDCIEWTHKLPNKQK